MKAKLVNPQRNAINYAHKKEVVNTMNLVVVRNGEPVNLITARFYMGRSNSASAVTCSVWVHGVDCSGVGSVASCGYHKGSEALYIVPLYLYASVTVPIL